MDDEIKTNLGRGDTWLRGLFILIFGAIYALAEIVLIAVVVFQFLHTLVTARANPRLQEFAQSLAAFIYQIVLYVTFNSDVRPFPFAPWPGPGQVDPRQLQHQGGTQ